MHNQLESSTKLLIDQIQLKVEDLAHSILDPKLAKIHELYPNMQLDIGYLILLIQLLS
jgi:hypothetical protein